MAGFRGEGGTDLNLALADNVSPVGVYANGAVVWSNVSDLVIDFLVGPMSPSDPEAKVVARLRLPRAMGEEFTAILTREFKRGMERYGGQE